MIMKKNILKVIFFSSLNICVAQTAVDFIQSEQDRITVPGNTAYDFGTGDFTIEANVGNYSFDSNVFPMILSARGEDEFNGFFVGIIESGNNPEVLFQLDGMNYSSSGANLDDGLCHHIAAKREGSTITVYIDGTNAYLLSSTANQNVTGDANLIIGNDEANNFINGMNGQISEVRLWNVARTQEEIIANYDRELENVSSLTNLVGYWKLNEGNGQEITDSSNLANDGVLGTDTGESSVDPQWELDAVCEMLLSANQYQKSIVEIYMNQQTNTIQVSKASNSQNYTIFSIDGKLINSGKLKNGQLNIDDFNSGLYFLNITDGASQFSFKFIIK